MKKCLLITFLFFAVAGVKAQCIGSAADPCVEVHQSVLDRAAHALDDYKALQDVVEKQAKALAATDVERAAVKQYMATVDATFAVLQKGIADRDTVIALQDKAMQAFATLVEKLTAQLNKPKSAWQKFVTTLKDIALIATGVTIGRGF